MKALFIGGTGNISTPVSQLAVARGVELYHLNRGMRKPVPGVKNLTADLTRPEQVRQVLAGHVWDVVVNWIAYTPENILRDVEVFEGKTSQYIFISSASVYQKPPVNPVITESTPLRNPVWQYSRDKIACEDLLVKLYRERGFPMTIVRPSHTYYSVIPVSLGGWEEFTVVDRMRRGMPVVVHGDGTSLWTMTHADDFAVGFSGLMNNFRAIGEAFHITSDEALTWNQIYQAVALAATGKEAELVHISSDFIADYADKCGYPSVRGTLLGDKSHTALFDNTKIKLLVPDYQAKIPFAEGIRRTLEWFDAEPARRVVKEET
ncbi:MAG TPA: NAD-dependent dehydratase, partial [Bacteroidales bacterium]|nr:NAD-dependent dehydratase [Bacteroidales bacterium]